MSLTTPTKPFQKKVEIIDDSRRSESPESEQDLPDKRWVGEVDLPERKLSDFLSPVACLTRIRRADMEPLLMESKRRFVLFPIQYHEVCCLWSAIVRV